MNFWVTTDLHLGHNNLISEFHTREQGFEEKILNNWAKNVKDDDVVIVLGDCVFQVRYWERLKSLPGKKWLVRGNHDKSSYSFYMRYFDFVGESISLNYLGYDILFTHQPQIFHEHDVNIHGHLHSLAKVESPCKLIPISLEDMGMGVFSLKKILKGID